MAEPSGPTAPLVAAVAPDGTPILVPQSAMPALARTEGGRAMGRLEERAARREIDLDQRYSGGLEGAVMPPLMGALRGASIGLSDPALLSAAEAIGGHGAREAVRGRLADYMEYAPVASAAGELAGIAGGALLGEEGGLANLPGLVSRLGRGAESGATRLLGGGLAGRVVGGALGGAGEMAIYGAGKAASEAALADEDITGEKLAAGATNSLYTGAIVGGGLGVLGGAGKALFSGLRAPSRAAVEGAEDVAGAVGRTERGTVADYLQKASDAKFIKGLGGSAADIRAIERNVQGGVERVAQEMKADLEANTGRIAFHTKEGLHEYVQSRIEEVGSNIGASLRKLDELKTGIAPSPQRIVERIQKELYDPLMLTRADGVRVPIPGQEMVVDALNKNVTSIVNAFEGGQPTFAQWHKMRVGYDKVLKHAQAEVSPAVEALQKMNRIIEGELETAGEQAAQSTGGAFLDAYKADKSLYQVLKHVEKLTERGASRVATNNSIGLGALMSGLTGGAIGGPVAGIAMGLVGKLVKDHGDMLAADLLGRAATISGAQRITGRVTSQLQRGVKELIPGAKPEAAGLLAPVAAGRAATASLGVTLSGDRRADYAKLSGVITSAAANPAATTERVAASLGDLSDHAPKASTSAIRTTLRGLSYLKDKLPPTRQDRFSLQPQLQPATRASDAEISQFMRAAQAIDDPLIVLREAKAGTLTRDHVEAVKAVYPRLYEEMRVAVMHNVVTSTSELPYATRIQLGILLDIPTDKTLSPEFRRAIQATYSSADTAEAESPPTTVSAPDIAGSAQTATQMAVERAM